MYLGNTDWLTGLTGTNRRFLPYNGGITDTQKQWLQTTLEKAHNANEKVIIFSHIPLCRGSCDDCVLLWNYEEILDIIHSFSCVIACFYGHDHSGGYCVDSRGIHHKTFESPLEAINADRTFATIHVFENQIFIDGRGSTQSMKLTY